MFLHLRFDKQTCHLSYALCQTGKLRFVLEKVQPPLLFLLSRTSSPLQPNGNKEARKLEKDVPLQVISYKRDEL